MLGLFHHTATVAVSPILFLIQSFIRHHASLALTISPHCVLEVFSREQSVILLQHAEGNSDGANLPHFLLSVAVELKEEQELDEARLRN